MQKELHNLEGQMAVKEIYNLLRDTNWGRSDFLKKSPTPLNLIKLGRYRNGKINKNNKSNFC